MDCLVRYGEIALKGKNRPRFEDRLKANIVALARREGADCRVRKLSGRFLVTTDRALPLSRVFGLHSFSPCIVTGAAPAAIEAHLATLAPHVAGKRFRITATRAQPAGLSSTEMNRRFGAFIQEQVQCTVSLEAFDMNFGIEVIGDAAYIFTETQPGFGGLPVGIEGLAGLYLDGEAAVLAGLLMMKRGCGLVAAGPFMDVALLERFLPDPPLRILAAATLAEAEAALASAGALALATAHRLPDAPPAGTRLPILTPLLAYDETRIRRELEAFACA